MATRRIDEWGAKELERRRCYSREDFKSILAAVKGEIPWRAKLRLRKDIEAAGKGFRFNRVLQTMPSSSETSGRLGRIEGAAQRLLDALGVRLDGDLPLALIHPLRQAAEQYGEDSDQFKYEPPTKSSLKEDIYSDYKDIESRWRAIARAIVREGPVESAVGGVVRLRTWAETARQEFEAQVADTKDKGQDRHKSDEALVAFIRDLAHAYRRAFDREPGVSRPSVEGGPGGPFIRFLDACLKPLGEEMTPGAIRELWRRHKPTRKDGATP